MDLTALLGCKHYALQALHFCSGSASSEAYCLREDISQNSSPDPSGAGRCWLAGSRELAVSCGASSQSLNGAVVPRMLLPGVLGLARGWHSPVQSSNFLVSMNTSGVLLILDSSSSPIPLLMSLSFPDHVKKLVFSGHHPPNPASPLPQQTD